MTVAFLRRFYAGGGTATTLANSMASTDTSFTIVSATGWPGAGGYFIAVIDRGTSSEEKIRCASNSGTTVTVATDGNGGRGYDGTTATTHNATATVVLGGGAIDFDEANQITYLLGNGALGQVLEGGGIGTLPSWGALSNVPLLARDNAIDGGTPPAAPGPFSIIAGGQSVTFSSGRGTLTFAGGGFPNHCLAVTVLLSIATVYPVLSYLSPSKTSVDLETSASESAAITVSYIAIGW